MKRVRRITLGAMMAVAVTAFIAQPAAQHVPPELYKDMRWRKIGPHRGGRTKAAAGIPSSRNVFYVGVVQRRRLEDDRLRPHLDADLRRSADGLDRRHRRSRRPIPNMVYVGSGEGLQRPDLSTGDGIYKSTDAGRTWTHLGLRDGQQIPQIVVDPTRTRTGCSSRCWAIRTAPTRSAASSDRRTAARRSRRCSTRTRTPAASTSRSIRRIRTRSTRCCGRRGRARGRTASSPARAAASSSRPTAATTWRPLDQGPAHVRRGRPGAHRHHRRAQPAQAAVRDGRGGPQRAGSTARTTPARAGRVVERRPARREPAVGLRGGEGRTRRTPTSSTRGSIVAWKSTDGGKTFTALRGAPGGDDYHRIWINPDKPDVMLMAADQGAIVTRQRRRDLELLVQPADRAVLPRTTDNAFPYRVCGGQQESGSACVASRGDDGQITFREWHPVGVEEYGYVAADPLDPDIVYGGKVTRFDRRTGQVQNVAPSRCAARDYRVLRTAPVLFSPLDPRTLYLRLQRRLEDDDRRPQLDADQPRPDARDMGGAAERRQVHRDRGGAAVAARRRLHDRAVVHGRSRRSGRAPTTG